MPDYLLDANVLVAHAILEHEHHGTVTDRLNRLAEEGRTFHVSPIIELGLLRNAMRIASLSIREARQLLDNERENLRLHFVPDCPGAADLPDGVSGYRQTTDAYLCALAEAHGLVLLTIDKGIPGAAKVLLNCWDAK